MSPFGNANVQPGAIDIDSLEFAEKFGGIDDDGSQEAPDYDQPADFDAAGTAAMNGKSGKRKSSSKTAAKGKATGKTEAQKAKEKAAAEAAKAKEREEAKAAKEAARKRETDLVALGMATAKPKNATRIVQVPLAELDGIDGGDPVSRTFVENVKLLGIQTPIQVVQEENGRYTIIAGKRRSQAARDLQMETIPAVVVKPDQVNEYVVALAENNARSNNVIEEHRMVKAEIERLRGIMDTGANDRKAIALIAKATGMSVAAVKKARDVGRLVPELMAAVEEGAMSSWSAQHASRLPVEAQERLVGLLEENGQITVDDVTNARRAKQADAVVDARQAADDTDQDMYADPEHDGEALDMGEFDANSARKGAVGGIRAALFQLRKLENWSSEEADAAAALESALALLGGEDTGE